MPDLGLNPYVNLGGWLFVVLLVVVSMVRGWLYSSNQIKRITDGYDNRIKELISVYERLLTDKDAQINNWKEAYNNSDTRGDVFAENQRSLVESVKTNNALIQAIISNRESIS